MDQPNVGIAEHVGPLDDKSFPIWRLRRRKLVPLACIALILSLLLFYRELLSSSKDAGQLKSVQSPSFNAPNTNISTSTTLTESLPAADTDSVHHAEEPIVFLFIIWSEPSAAEGALLIKVSYLHLFQVV